MKNYVSGGLTALSFMLVAAAGQYSSDNPFWAFVCIVCASVLWAVKEEIEKAAPKEEDE